MTANCWLSEDGTKLVTLSPDKKSWIAWKLRQPPGVGAHWVMETSRNNAGQAPQTVFERFQAEQTTDGNWVVVDCLFTGRPWVAMYAEEWVDAGIWARELAVKLNEKDTGK